jgi:hypothetical protein
MIAHKWTMMEGEERGGGSVQALHGKLGYQNVPDLEGRGFQCERSENASYNVISLILAQSLNNDDRVRNQIYETN